MLNIPSRTPPTFLLINNTSTDTTPDCTNKSPKSPNESPLSLLQISFIRRIQYFFSSERSSPHTTLSFGDVTACASKKTLSMSEWFKRVPEHQLGRLMRYINLDA